MKHIPKPKGTRKMAYEPHFSEKPMKSGSTNPVARGKKVSVSHGPRAGRASGAGGGRTHGSQKGFHGQFCGEQESHAKRGMR